MSELFFSFSPQMGNMILDLLLGILGKPAQVWFTTVTLWSVRQTFCWSLCWFQVASVSFSNTPLLWSPSSHRACNTNKLELLHETNKFNIRNKQNWFQIFEPELQHPKITFLSCANLTYGVGWKNASSPRMLIDSFRWRTFYCENIMTPFQVTAVGFLCLVLVVVVVVFVFSRSATVSSF